MATLTTAGVIEDPGTVVTTSAYVNHIPSAVVISNVSIEDPGTVTTSGTFVNHITSYAFIPSISIISAGTLVAGGAFVNHTTANILSATGVNILPTSSIPSAFRWS